jgi:hypothetical protein
MKLTKRKVLFAGIVGPLLVVAGFLVIEHFRGTHGLDRELQLLRAQGEAVDVPALTPPSSPAGLDGGWVFLSAVGHLGRLNINDVPSPWRGLTWGKARVATREKAWQRSLQPNATNLLTVEELAQTLETAKPDLVTIRDVLNRTNFCFDVRYSLNSTWLHLAPSRSASQWLRVASFERLVAGDLEGSLANLEALAALPRCQAEERLLISQLVALAEVDRGVSAIWEALQTPGWTEPQLARLQAAWAAGTNYAVAMARSFEMERAMDREMFEGMTLARLDALLGFAGVGVTGGGAATTRLQQHLDALREAGHRAFHRHVYLPLWSFAWSGQDEVRLLHQWTVSLQALREMASAHSFASIKARIPPASDDDTPPKSVRGYYDRCRYPVSLSLGESPWRALGKLAMVETMRQIALTAIVLRRYQLRHGQPAPDLRALVPEFLPAVPVDPMDGQPLRYRLKPDGGSLLYSVGEDSVDNGGEPTPTDPSSSSSFSMYRGRDLVWPAPATPREIEEAEKGNPNKARR